LSSAIALATFDPGARIWIASWIDSMARSAARAPCAIRSAERWKSNQPI